MISPPRWVRLTGAEAGEYTCTATNAAGSASARAVLVVQRAPRIVEVTPRPRDGGGLVMVEAGRRLALSCSASGDPLPAVSWERLGGGAASTLL